MIIPIEPTDKTFSCPHDVATTLRDILMKEDAVDQDKEHFWVFHLNARHQIKLLELVGLGTVNSCPVHPREVFTRAVGCRASALIVAHNHPSGEAQPSTDDIEVTDKLVDAGKILDIPILDHVIVTSTTFKSLKELGLMG